MDDPDWEEQRAALIAGISSVPQTVVMLRNGDELRIKTASTEDAALVHSITHKAFNEFRGVLDPPNGSDSETPEDVAGQMLKGGALIGYLNGRAAASLRITVNPDHLYIGRVGVTPHYRNKGIGKAMILRAENIAAHLRLPEVRLGTREKLTDNVDLYLKLGYTIDRVIRHSRGPDNVVLFGKASSRTQWLS